MLLSPTAKPPSSMVTSCVAYAHLVGYRRGWWTWRGADAERRQREVRAVAGEAGPVSLWVKGVALYLRKTVTWPSDFHGCRWRAWMDARRRTAMARARVTPAVANTMAWKMLYPSLCST